ncbi:amino acid transporter [Verminephrobacter aporrectodeae subsp. tuberculatae]|uniref:Amino acid transporter n=3 Tax=Verminephrobacter TaxID=364316 RepID=A0ABT3KU44_9BURK|nr:LysE family transporter [Verminephrobacter aporrectodeae]MCW5321849.1 amino acid transporter [Verminephrobacter aporrectodeae subsp. tuberculatae]MCW8163430.1 amino acid transporter [Verminephrobacter aporrectodeae subsp. tuberculatae]MCW8167659.1 amino acid transporter [Verminephrobacter aporrectodeae subsp. tuberculatae]
MTILHACVHGFSSGAMLIIAIGAQNVFVLRQGLRREHVFGVVLVCALSDAILIQVGVWGLGATALAWPALASALRWLGAAFLLLYALRAAARAWRPGGLDPGASVPLPSARGAVLTAAALTWLNPHVYLDTVLLLGAIASPYGDAPRAGFAVGATLASCVWFAALGYGARWLAPVFAAPQAWRVLDALIALTMGLLAVGLLRSAG